MITDKLNYLLFTLLACFWSGSFVAIKMMVVVMPPYFSAMLRVAIALFCLFLIIRITQRKTALSFILRCKIWIIGLFSLGLPFFFLFWGEQLISAGLAGILNGTLSLWTFILGLIFFRNHTVYSTRKLFGLILGFVGIVIVFSPMLNANGVHPNVLGAIAVLGMAISYAIGTLLNQQLFKRHSEVDFCANLYHQHWSALLFLLFASFCFEKWPSLHTLATAYSAWLAAIYMGVFSTAIAWMIYCHLIRAWDAVRASTVLYIVPVLSLVWDFLFFHNRPYVAEIVGMLVVLSGVVLIQWMKKKQVSSLS